MAKIILQHMPSLVSAESTSWFLSKGSIKSLENAYQYRERPNFLVQQTVIKVAEQNEHDDKKMAQKK